MIPRLAFLILITAFASTSYVADVSAQLVSIDEKADFSDNISDVEGCTSAIIKARRTALEKTCGLIVTGGSNRFLDDEVDTFSRSLFEEVGGRIVIAKVSDKKIEYIRRSPHEQSSVKTCSIHMEMDVVCDSGKRNSDFAPDFDQNVHLNESTYRDGESLVITIKAPHDLYISIFQYIPYDNINKNVLKIFPNDLQSRSYIRKGESLTIPDSTESSYSLTAFLPKDKDRVTEELMIIGTIDETSFPTEMSLEAFHHILSEISLDRRREVIVPYRIVKKGQRRN